MYVLCAFTHEHLDRYLSLITNFVDETVSFWPVESVARFFLCSICLLPSWGPASAAAATQPFLAFFPFILKAFLQWSKDLLFIWSAPRPALSQYQSLYRSTDRHLWTRCIHKVRRSLGFEAIKLWTDRLDPKQPENIVQNIIFIFF